MGKYQELTKDMPWKSLGRETVASKLARSLLTVGSLPFLALPPSAAAASLVFDDPDPEQVLMNIVGTAIQVDKGKLVTCTHVVDALKEKQKPYLLSRTYRRDVIIYRPYPIHYALPYYDPRTDQPNPSVDLSVVIVPAISTKDIPYEVPNIKWGDSARLGVGDRVVIGGYPYGREMFLFTQSNRGLIQPTFYSGIISAIIPATAPLEIRLLQLDIPVAGGMSGGAVFLPETGDVVGMVTSGIHIGEIPMPITYAIPSEVIAPFVEVITYDTRSGGV
jgi:S1-C subfamily serine protease